MAKWNTEWKVHSHGPIEKLSERVWRVEGGLPKVPMRRVMTLAKRADGSVVVHNGIALGEADMAAIEAWGPIQTIVVPNSYHRLDAAIFARRYPSARVLCPPGAKAAVEKAVKLDGFYADLPSDGAVELVDLEGTKQREGVMIVRDDSGATVVFNDAVFNMPHVSGVAGFVLQRITGSTGGPRVSNLVRWFVVADKPAFRAHLERLADLPDLRRIIVSHHLVIESDPGATLRAVAAAL